MVAWTRNVLDTFIKEAMLTEDEVKILKMRINGDTIVKISLETGMSASSVNKIIKTIKIKYDSIQEYTGIPPRKNYIHF